MQKQKQILEWLSKLLITLNNLVVSFMNEHYAGQYYIKKAIHEIQKEIEVLYKIEDVADKIDTTEIKK